MEWINFKGWEDTYALFEIRRDERDNPIDKISVAHQGNWIDEDAMNCHPQFRLYEDVQKAMGSGLLLIGKYFSQEKGRTFFDYQIIDDNATLAVPASGEELDFEIFGLLPDNTKILLLKREL